MNPPDDHGDDPLADLLADYDEALAAGVDPAARPATPAPPGLRARLGPLQRLLLRLERDRLAETTAHEGDGTTPCPDAGASLPPAGLPGRLGRFHILRELGQGGFGVVYLARDPALGRLIALKVPRPEAFFTPQFRQRFLREAQLAAELDHPNLVHVHEAGEAGAVCYIASAYCPGRSLAEWLLARGRPLPPRPAARLVATLAGAVHHAHERGVIHRDLKPANVLLQQPGGEDGLAELGVPRVCDFGLARSLGGAESHTRTGAVLGTPEYMAPEQAAGRTRDVSVRTDVYALGAILYECLTGRPPFRDDAAAALLQRVLAEPPVPPRRLAPGVPRELEAVCLKCLEKEPERRYQSAAELADDLKRFLGGEPVRARPAGAAGRLLRWCRRRPAKAGLFAVSALVLFVFLPGWAWYESRLAGARERTDLVERAAEAEAKARSSAEEAARAHEFYRLLFEVKERRARRPPGWTWDNLRDLRRAAGMNPSPDDLPELRTESAAALAGVSVRRVRAVAPGFTALHAAFTPDGGLLALAQGVGAGPADMRVLLVDLATGKLVRELSFPSFPRWQARSGRGEASRSLAVSPDGRWLVVGTRSGHLHAWDLRAASPKVATWRGHDKEVSRLAFDPALRALFSLSGGELKRWDVARGKPLPFPSPPRRVDDVAALPALRAVAYLADQDLCTLDGETLSPLGPPVAVGADRFVPSPGGATLLTHAGRLHLHDRETGRRLCTLPGSEAARRGDGLCFSPDGSLAAWVCEETRRLRLWDVAGGHLEADAVVPGALGGVAFHPAGRLLAVVAGGQTFLYEVSGGDAHEVKAQHGGPLKDVAFAGDGGALACLAESPGTGHCQVALWPAGKEDARHPPLGWVLDNPARGFFALGVSPAGSAVCCTSGGHVLCWDRPGGRVRPCGAVGEGGELKRLYFGPDGTLWAAAGHEVRWGRPPGEPLTACWTNGPADRQAGLVFYAVAAGRRRALAGRRDGRLFLFDATSRRHVRDWRVCDSPVWGLALSPDEELALAGTELGKVRLLSLPRGEVVRDLHPHGDAVTGVAFLGGGLLLSASRDATVRLCRADGSVLLTLPAPGPVERIALSPDGTRLAVVVAEERGVRLWHLDRLGEALERLGVPAGAFGRPARPPAPAPRPPAPPDPEPPAGPNGLKADLFVGTNFQRKVKERFDARVDFRWGTQPPDPALAPDFFSVRWTGWLKAPRPGRYVLTMRHDDGFRLWLDGKLMMGNPSRTRPSDKVVVTLTGRPHSLRLDYYEAWGPAHCSLLWRPPGTREYEVIPPEALFHDRAAAEKAAVPARQSAPKATPAR